jgi:hypothetical protein
MATPNMFWAEIPDDCETETDGEKIGQQPRLQADSGQGQDPECGRDHAGRIRLLPVLAITEKT